MVVYDRVSEMNMENLANRWLHLHAIGKAERTVESYQSIIRSHIVPTLGAYEPDNEDLPIVIADMLSLMIREGHERLAELTYVTLHQITHGLVPDPMQGIGRPKYRAETVEAWENVEIALYIGALSESSMDTLLLIGITCGLRRGELLGLNWEDIDLEKAMLHVERQIVRTDRGLQETSPKTESGRRDVPLFPDLVGELKKRKSVGRVCDTSPESLRRRHKAICEVAGVRYIGLHGLRHSYATAIVRGGGSISGLQRILGHKHYSTTADVYAPPDAAIACTAARAYPVIVTAPLTLNQGVQGSSP